jgi:hypothetical protein
MPEQNPQIYRRCYEVECEDCSEPDEAGAKTASCRYGARFVGKSHRGSMVVGRGQECYHHRAPMQVSGLAQSSPSGEESDLPSLEEIEKAHENLDIIKRTPAPDLPGHLGICVHH